MPKTDFARERLKKSGLKVTKARLSILSVLKTEAKPLTVAEILHFIKKQHKVDADEVTVYRVLEALEKTDLIDKVNFREDKFRYEIKGDDHHHLICENCGTITEIMDCPIDEVEEQICHKEKFLIKGHAMEFFGLCQKCQ